MKGRIHDDRVPRTKQKKKRRHPSYTKNYTDLLRRYLKVISALVFNKLSITFLFRGKVIEFSNGFVEFINLFLQILLALGIFFKRFH